MDNINEIYEDMVVTLRENVSSYTIVKKLDAEFKRSWDSLEDEPRWRRPVTETIAKIRDVIMTDRRVTEYYTATELGISQDRIHAVTSYV